jgi:hypothetical protein
MNKKKIIGWTAGLLVGAGAGFWGWSLYQRYDQAWARYNPEVSIGKIDDKTVDIKTAKHTFWKPILIPPGQYKIVCPLAIPTVGGKSFHDYNFYYQTADHEKEFKEATKTNDYSKLPNPTGWFSPPYPVYYDEPTAMAVYNKLKNTSPNKTVSITDDEAIAVANMAIRNQICHRRALELTGNIKDGATACATMAGILAFAYMAFGRRGKSH